MTTLDVSLTHSMYDSLKDAVARYTTFVGVRRGRHSVPCIGSAVKVRIANRQLLLTAAHIFDRYHLASHFGVANVLDADYWWPTISQNLEFVCGLKVGQEKAIFKLQDVFVPRDNKDFAVVNLATNPTANVLLEESSFLPEDRIRTSTDTKHNRILVCSGYPQLYNPNLLNPDTQEFKSHHIMYVAEANYLQDVMFRKYFSKRKGVADEVYAPYTKKAFLIDGRQTQTPNPRGLSGGPLWAFPAEQSAYASEYVRFRMKLEGIITEWEGDAVKSHDRIPLIVAKKATLGLNYSQFVCIVS